MCSTSPTKLAALTLFAAALWFTGCGKKVSDIASSIKDTAADMAGKAKDAAQDATQAAQNMTGKARAALDLAGSMDLTLDAPLKANACYVKFIPSKTGRPSVLQLQSYRDAKQESFPAAFVRAQVSAANLTQLNGQTVPAELFVQGQQDGPTWSTNKELVQLKIMLSDEKNFSAEVVAGSLFNSNTGVSQAVKGVFKGALQ